MYISAICALINIFYWWMWYSSKWDYTTSLLNNLVYIVTNYVIPMFFPALILQNAGVTLLISSGTINKARLQRPSEGCLDMKRRKRSDTNGWVFYFVVGYVSTVLYECVLITNGVLYCIGSKRRRNIWLTNTASIIFRSIICPISFISLHLNG